MREALDPWVFVYAVYAIAAIGTLALVAGAWLAMRRAEARRDRARGKRP